MYLSLPNHNKELRALGLLHWCRSDFFDPVVPLSFSLLTMSTYRAVLTGNQVKAAKKVYEHPEECERVCDIEKHAQTVSAMLEAEQKGDFAASAELARAAADERETVQKKREGEKKERKAAEKERKAMELQKRKERFAKTVAALNRNASEKQSTAVDKAGPTTAKAGPSNPPNPEHLRSRPTRTFHRVWPCPRQR